jgi:hypothetical protein
MKYIIYTFFLSLFYVLVSCQNDTKVKHQALEQAAYDKVNAIADSLQNKISIPNTKPDRKTVSIPKQSENLQNTAKKETVVEVNVSKSIKTRENSNFENSQLSIQKNISTEHLDIIKYFDDKYRKNDIIIRLENQSNELSKFLDKPLSSNSKEDNLLRNDIVLSKMKIDKSIRIVTLIDKLLEKQLTLQGNITLSYLKSFLLEQIDVCEELEELYKQENHFGKNDMYKITQLKKVFQTILQTTETSNKNK